MFKSASNFSQHRARIAPQIKRPKPNLPKELRTIAGQRNYVQSLADLIAKKRWDGKNAYALASALNSCGRKTPFGERWTSRSAGLLQKAIRELSFQSKT